MTFLRQLAGRTSTRSDSTSDSDSDEEREYDIRQARCEVHRRKIGIKLDKKLQNVNIDGGDTKQDELVEYIRNNFSMRECMRYVPKNNSAKPSLTTSPRCHCGASMEEHWHQSMAQKSPQHSSRTHSSRRESELGTLTSMQPAAMGVGLSAASSPRSNLILTPRVTQELLEQRKSRDSKKATNTIFPKLQLPRTDDISAQRLPPIPGRGETPRPLEPLKFDEPSKSVQETGTSLGSPSSSPKEVRKVEWEPGGAFIDLPTNAFGKVEFANDEARSKPAKYIRLAQETDMETVITLLIKMRMMDPHRPSLAISVIGGAKNFSLDGKKKEIFNRGLVKAAQTTNAWILTSGSYLGVMKAVGEAVRDGQSLQMAGHQRVTHSLRCIGIASWGYVQNRQDLVCTDGAGCWPATYHVDPVVRHGQPVSLDPNHTHFILVDDGYRNSFRYLT